MTSKFLNAINDKYWQVANSCTICKHTLFAFCTFAICTFCTNWWHVAQDTKIRPHFFWWYALSLQILLFQVTNWLTSLSDAAICWARENKQDAREVSMMQSFEMQTGANCHYGLSSQAWGHRVQILHLRILQIFARCITVLQDSAGIADFFWLAYLFCMRWIYIFFWCNSLVDGSNCVFFLKKNPKHVVIVI